MNNETHFLKNTNTSSVTFNHTAINITLSAALPLAQPSFLLLAVRIAITTASLCLNAGLLIFHAIKPAFITDFTTYLLFLYLANVIYLIGDQPLLFWSEIAHRDIGSLGRSLCTFSNYFHRVASIVPLMCHVLVAVNRLWALRFPLHYRRRHTRRVALLICLGMAGYVHALTLPPFFIYMPYRYQPLTEFSGICRDAFIPNYASWARIDSIMNRFMPLIVIILIYIYLIVQRCVGRSQVESANNSTNRTSTTRGNADPDATASLNRPVRQQRLHRKVVRPFLVLTLTTVGVIVCWLPLDIIFLCQLVLNLPVPPAVVQAFLMLYTLQLLFDPLMWICSLRRRKA
ncbi:5-hydroxytryptamine receptor 5A-like [Paramacrobiotus metropolitanus]|uniref:5-hydroxytryptamine receptor 5A-like n=1 Tax=Paramacrobiotus metropolitanus TaxID=2943436 RepID=UPI0024458470|nr:5-hydroxytryptamine receptor 5A-like [Paramacrobiotus metropolitanus]